MKFAHIGHSVTDYYANKSANGGVIQKSEVSGNYNSGQGDK